MNFDLYRENLTYMDIEFINIKKLMDISWNFWSQYNLRDIGPKEMIIKNKTAYTDLTILNIQDMDPIIDKFEKLNGDF